MMSTSKTIFVFLLLFLMQYGFVLAAKHPLYIGSISPLTGKSSWWGCGIPLAAHMAFDMINNDTSILKDYELKIVSNNSKGETGRGMRVLYDYLTNWKILMLLGPSRSNVATAVADTAKFWKLIQVSAAASSGELSNSIKYPYFLRTIPSSSAMSSAFVALAQTFGWKRVSILYYSREMQMKTASDLRKLCEANNITVISFGSFSDPFDAHTQMQHIKDIDSRIIFGLLQKTTSVTCQIFKLNMYGRHYAWLIHTPDKHGWWQRTYKDTNCTEEEISSAANHMITIKSMNTSRSAEKGISGLTPKRFQDQYKLYAKENKCNVTDYGTFAFDAAWLIALALNKTETELVPDRNLSQFYYKNKWMSMMIRKNLIRTGFRGVTGMVRLQENGDRYGHFEVSQIQDGILRVIGTHDELRSKFSLNAGMDFIWKGGFPPSDRLIVVPLLIGFPVVGFIVICCFAVGGIILSLVFLYCNIVYRQKRFIKMSSPNINNLIIAGCIIAYLSVILFAVDGEHLSSLVCKVRVITLNISFTLAFGAMFIKTWRVHRITRKIRNKRRVLHDIHLVGLEMIFLMIDIVILSTWLIVNPLEKDYKWFDIKVNKPSATAVIYKQKIAYCRTTNVFIWLVVLYGSKTLLLLFGLFLAWETRKVKISALNDSQHIGMAVYNVVIVCIVGVPIIQLLKDEMYEASFIITTFCIMSCTTLTLCLVFVPKVRRLLKSTADEITDNGISFRSRFDSKRTDCTCDCHIQDVDKRSPCILGSNAVTQEKLKMKKLNILNNCNIKTKPSYVI